MEKITLESDQTIEINGAIIGKEIAEEILYLQKMEEPGINSTAIENGGIIEESQSWKKFLAFLASEAESFNDQETALAYFKFISLQMDYIQKFRIPGTKEVKFY